MCGTEYGALHLERAVRLSSANGQFTQLASRYGALHPVGPCAQPVGHNCPGPPVSHVAHRGTPPLRH
ncbi:hypothetical protein Y032_0117g665 [Ancylostoma ceylanicum]|uniref:Uncharacterized protein n=1 Tax=Ancylostoma ceylanicum TaxID=53326 RepID=A0A016TC50_9BILA|nr:hypothetical protein Y032_0117g665 [Ancylostoma ceylanicum]